VVLEEGKKMISDETMARLRDVHNRNQKIEFCVSCTPYFRELFDLIDAQAKVVAAAWSFHRSRIKAPETIFDRFAKLEQALEDLNNR
jgi:hypothetical protein